MDRPPRSHASPQRPGGGAGGAVRMRARSPLRPFAFLYTANWLPIRFIAFSMFWRVLKPEMRK
jgi:hypothetical protein